MSTTVPDPVERRLARLADDQRAAATAPPGPVLAEHLGLTLSAGREPRLEPFQFWLLAEAGMFDPEPVLADVRAGRYPVVLAGWRLLRLPGLREALAVRYVAAEEIGPYRVWRLPDAA